MIQGITFDLQNVTNSDDGALYQMQKNDGIISGISVTASGAEITIGTGRFLAGGRQIKIAGNETITLPENTADSNGRLVFKIDESTAASENEFTQGGFYLQFSASTFPALEKENINDVGTTGTIYEIEFARFEVAANAITNVDVTIPHLTVTPEIIIGTTDTPQGVYAEGTIYIQYEV